MRVTLGVQSNEELLSSLAELYLSGEAVRMHSHCNGGSRAFSQVTSTRRSC